MRSSPASPIRPLPYASARPWAGSRLATAGASVGELWLAGPGLDAGDGTGRTLDELARAEDEALVGTAGLTRYGARFPLLVKLIDAADWLSLQVHPDDGLARELAGPHAIGKAEAWVVLEADPGARLITGPRRGVGAEALREAIGSATLGHDACEERDAVPGEVLLLPAGTLHAIGAGTFLYEIEQPSDITYRISDWGRPPVPGRQLHPAESLRAVDPAGHALVTGTGWALDGGRLSTGDFRLEIVGPGEQAERRPAGRSLEVVTAIEGSAGVHGDGWSAPLDRFGTVVVPAACDRYEIEVSPGGRVCVGALG